MRQEVNPKIAIAVVAVVVVTAVAVIFIQSNRVRDLPDPKTRHSKVDSKEAADAIRNRILEKQQGK